MYQKSDQQSYSHLLLIGYCGQEIAIELLVEVSQPFLRKTMSFCCCNPKILLAIRITDSQIKLGNPSDLVFPFRSKCQKKTDVFYFKCKGCISVQRKHSYSFDLIYQH